MRVLAFLAALAVPFPALAQDDGLFPTAELRSRIESSKTQLDRKDYSLWNNQLRVGARWRHKDFDAEAAYDIAYRHGDYFKTVDESVAGGHAPRSELSFGGAIDEGVDHRTDHRFYRANVGFENGPWVVRVGRQRTEWSEGLAFTAIDILHARQPLDVREDREPIDSLYAKYGPVALEVDPGPRKTDTAALLRVGRAAEGSEIHAYVGQAKEEREVRGLDPEHPRLVGGASVRVPMFGGRLLGEYASLQSNLTPDFDRALVSLAWGRRTHEWLGVEYFFNGQGSGPAGYNRVKGVRGDWALLGRHYVMAQLGNPESVKLVWNVDDGGYMVEFAERRPFVERLWVSFGVQFYGGGPATEFGALDHRLWAGLGWVFGGPAI